MRLPECVRWASVLLQSGWLRSCLARSNVAATRAILQFFALALLWINLFMLYALRYLGAPATGLLRFQSIGWLSILSLMAFQVNRYGFVAQQETLGIQLSLFFVSAYLGYAP
jgi:hypothetical protein